MRVIKEIPHERFKIQILNYNSKYILKIEIGQFEQTFKIGELDINSLDDIEKMITPELLQNCMKRFVEMRNDWESEFKNLNNH
jgi:hypothetical protein